MAQRCSYCGKTKKQHNGKPCIDVAGFTKALDRREGRPGECADRDCRREHPHVFGFGCTLFVQEQKCKAVIVSSSSGDWEGLYVDGVLKVEGHSLAPFQIFDALGIEHESFEAEEGWLEDRGNLPDKLSDVERS